MQTLNEATAHCVSLYGKGTYYVGQTTTFTRHSKQSSLTYSHPEYKTPPNEDSLSDLGKLVLDGVTAIDCVLRKKANELLGRRG